MGVVRLGFPIRSYVNAKRVSVQPKLRFPHGIAEKNIGINFSARKIRGGIRKNVAFEFHKKSHIPCGKVDFSISFLKK